MSEVKSSEILFVKCVRDGIPNRDPLNDSDARRLFGPEDGRISLSDVSIKRDVRDYVQAKYEGDGDKFIFCRAERDDKGKLFGRENLVKKLLERAGVAANEDKREALPRLAFDVRAFGAVYSVEKQSFNLTGPVQFGWAHSLHPVDTIYTQGTCVMPSKDTKEKDTKEKENNETDTGVTEGKGQGTIWTMYTLPFAVFCMPGVINAKLAESTAMGAADVDLLLESLWHGTLQRQARGRGIQLPLLLMHVEYADPFYRIGFLEDGIALHPGPEAWRGGKPPASLADVSLDVSNLAATLNQATNAGQIARIRYWADDRLNVDGELPGTQQTGW